ISNDSINWTRYDVHQASINSTPTTNPSVFEVTISNIVANQSTVYIRLQIKGESHYYWMVDDFKLYEPYPYDIRVMNYWIDYKEGKWENYFRNGEFIPYYKKKFTGTPYYNPYYAFQKIVTSRAIAINYGGSSFPETIITTKVVKEDGTVLDEKTSAIVTNIAPGEFDTSFVATHNFQIPKTIESVGSYYYEGVVSGVEEDQIPENNVYRYDFNITENVFGYTNPKTASTDRISPFVMTDCEAIGAIFFLDPPTENIPGTETPAPYVLRGINTYISNDTYNWKIWRAGKVAYLTAEFYEHDAHELTELIISSASIPIDSTMVDSWVFLPFISDGISENITPTEEGHAYAAVIRFLTDERFFIGADKVTQPSFYSNLLIGWYNSVGWSGMETNISMELIVDKYGESPTGGIKVTVLQKKRDTGEIRPLYGSPVEIRVPNINENGELVEMDFITQNTGVDGVVTLDSLRSGSYAVVATLVTEGGAIAVDEEGNPIRKLTGVTVQGSGQYEVTITFDVDILNIEEYDLLRDVKLYPVPSNNTITVESPVNISRIVISNIVGQVVQTIENPTQVQTISVANFATGVYMVTLFDNNGNSTTQRFIKQ
ncbi:MAG TPA: T9SS type A sorting domain-containing protein, partial [Salinivirgaceae bacterium]|nr:T9SS type A sorting domain-containing protein [Salinivirgaceae bacterium]